MNQTVSIRRTALAAWVKGALAAFALAVVALTFHAARAEEKKPGDEQGPGEMDPDDAFGHKKPASPPDNPAPPPDNGGNSTKPDDGGDELVIYVVQILIPQWGVHSRQYADEDSAELVGISLSYNPEIKVEADEVNGGYALWIRVTNWTDYQKFDNKQEAEDFKAALLAKHNAGRLEVRIEEVRN